MRLQATQNTGVLSRGYRERCLLCRRQLASLVAYIPLPVVAGYLAYVGYFCVAAGMSQGTRLEIRGPLTWFELATHLGVRYTLACTPRSTCLSILCLTCLHLHSLAGSGTGVNVALSPGHCPVSV